MTVNKVSINPRPDTTVKSLLPGVASSSEIIWLRLKSPF